MISQFLAQYDEFRTLEEDKVKAALVDAEAYCPQCWGSKRQQGLFLVAAHILTLRWLQMGAVASTAVVQAKGTQAGNTMASADGWFHQSSYGQQFLQLRLSIVVTGFPL